jgi:4-carboxymuconolactone decarboxylase
VMNMNRYETGKALLNRLHGGHAGEGIVNALGDIAPDMVSMIIEWGFGEIMNHTALDLKTRELCIIASLVTQGDTQPQLRAHIEAALNVDTPREAIVETILQTAIYAGFPRAVNAMLFAKQVFADIDQKA